ncbi:MAG: pitrilysin family protein, partial [Planctomycetota bacterium]|nr:pitrilysin family protein [Planctomycetota bacterium]
MVSRWTVLRALGLCGALALACCQVVRADEPAGVTLGGVVEGIAEYRLENGLRLLLLPDDSKPTVTVNITYYVGSRHEGYGEAGMAHLLEHMLFKGTPNLPNIPAALKERGGNFNGTTWVDRTNYYETLPASDENLEFALRLEADRMVNSNVAEADLKSEMTVVRNEFEMGENSPQGVLYQRMLAAAFEWHNYGKSTIGNRSDIERVPIKNLKEFYHRFYQPDNALLIIAGKFDEDTALELTAKYFGGLEPS